MRLTSGIDLVEINRIRQSLQHPRFLTRVFSDEERKFFQEKKVSVQTIAANFCAKEAFSKALGTGIRGFALTDISVLRDPLGAPYFFFQGKAKEIVEQRNLTLSVSLTHTEEYAAAVVTALEG